MRIKIDISYQHFLEHTLNTTFNEAKDECNAENYKVALKLFREVIYQKSHRTNGELRELKLKVDEIADKVNHIAEILSYDENMAKTYQESWTPKHNEPARPTKDSDIMAQLRPMLFLPLRQLN